MTTEAIKKAYREQEAADYLGVSRSTLRQARMEGPRERRISSPPYVKFGRSVRYLKEDLDQWLSRHRVVAGK